MEPKQNWFTSLPDLSEMNLKILFVCEMSASLQRSSVDASSREHSDSRSGSRLTRKEQE